LKKLDLVYIHEPFPVEPVVEERLLSYEQLEVQCLAAKIDKVLMSLMIWIQG